MNTAVVTATSAAASAASKTAMNALELELNYPFADLLPEPGGSYEVAPGVRWIRMRLPFALNHINLWLLRDCIGGREGWTAVDCCISADASKEQWESIIANELQGLPILRVIATHMHPDHIGLAYWLCQRFECALWISTSDYLAARLASSKNDGFGGDRAVAHYRSHGLLDDHSLSQIRERSGYYINLVPDVPRSYVRLQDGDQLRIGGNSWRCIAGYGHAPEHISLYSDSANVLIAGDMVLPRISTNVSVFEMEPEANPLPLFLRSTKKFYELPANALVLPSHGKPFQGLHTRVKQLHEHHAERLLETAEACRAKPLCAAELVPIMFKRELDLHQLTFAMGEALAHMHMLWHAGELQRERGADGVWRFG